MKRNLLLFFFFIAGLIVKAQQPPGACPGTPPLAGACGDACVLCDIDGYAGSNDAAPNTEAPPGFCAPTVHNARWIGFVAGSTNIQFEMVIGTCDQGDGLQISIYETVDCSTFNQVSNCNPDQNPNTTFVYTASGLTPGGTYFFVIDGSFNDVCNFQINVISGSVTAPPVTQQAQIDFPNPVCPGGLVEVSASDVPGAAAYTWTVNGNIAGYDQNITLTMPPTPGTVQVCVTPSNPCNPPGPTSCRTINVQALPRENLNETICEGEVFTYQGNAFSTQGVHDFTYVNDENCIQPVRLILTVEQPSETTLQEEICDYETFVVGNEEFNTTGLHVVNLTSANGCDSTVYLELEVHPSYYEIIFEDICQGEAYTLSDGMNTFSYNQTGVYDVPLVSSEGCDSIVGLYLTVYPRPQPVSLFPTICQGEYFEVGLLLFDSPGFYEVTIPSIGGCDSIVRLNLTVAQPAVTNLGNIRICEEETFFAGGQPFTNPGTYSVPLRTTQDCDSTVNFTLIVQPDIVTTTPVAICEGDSYEWNNQVYSQPGVYERLFTASTGCDSTARIDLAFLPNPETILQEVICNEETFAVGDSTYTASGQYRTVLPAANGCDSIVLLDLTVLPPNTNAIQRSVCEGESLPFGDSTLTQTGTYLQTFTAANGCDSAVTLQLTVLDIPETPLPVTICNGASYTLGGQTFTASGQATLVFLAANGCDSLVHLDLTVLPPVETFLVREICTGQEFRVGTSVYTAAGDYTDVLRSSLGCDSTVYLTLTVADVLEEFLDIEICEGESFVVGNSVYTEPGAFQDSFVTPDGCDSVVYLNLTVHPIPVTNLTPVICAGESFSAGNAVYSQAGTYQEILTAATGCDSIVNVILTVNPVPETFLVENICDGETFEVGTSIYDRDGTYTDTLTAVNGCDSIIYLNLSVLPVPETFLVESICDDEVYQVGASTFSQTGTYREVLIAANGCDSIVYLDLTMLETPETTFSALICDGETYTLGSQNLTQSGTYAETFTAANGCDSTVTLQLAVAPNPLRTINASICNGATYQVGTSTYDQSGTYRDTLRSALGCDSVVVLNLTVTSFYETNLEVSVCEGEIFAVGTNTYGQSGLFTNQFVSQDGCDSIVNLDLTVFEIPETSLNVSICAGESYRVGTTDYQTTGTFTSVLRSFTGCDSLVFLDLTVNPVPETFLRETICAGESYRVGSSVYSAAGNYRDVLTAASGCDSIVFLDLTVLPIPETELDIRICEGELFEVGNSTYSQSGTYQDILTAASGCDSVVNLQLIVLPIPETMLDVSICQGEVYRVGQAVFSQTGAYQEVLTAASGCDSIVHLQLTVHPVFETVLNEDICDDDRFQVGGEFFSTPGTYQVPLRSVEGCDSLVVLNLVTHPCQLSLDAAVTDVSCSGGGDGAIRLMMTIGTPPYFLNWQAMSSLANGADTIYANQVAFDITGLAAGAYRLQIIDSYGITAVEQLSVGQPAPLALALTTSGYGPYQISCPEEQDGTIQVSPSGGTPPYRFSWSGGQTAAALSELGVGEYRVTVTDRNGCQISGSAVLAAPPPVTARATVVDPACFGDTRGQISIDGVSGGVGPYLYSLQGQAFTSSGVFPNLGIGSYTVQVQDANGCLWTEQLVVNQPERLTVDLGPDEFIRLGDSIRLFAETSYPVETYRWEGNTEVNCGFLPECADPFVRPLQTSAYSVTVSDVNGCTASDRITVFVNKERRVFIPNAFSPNNDGDNDLLVLFAGSDVVRIRSFLVFNRWGETLFELYNFQPNDPAYGWDGSHRGRLLNTGVYVYVAEVEFIDGETVLFKGDITLIR